ncbi:MAG: hypothetical protein IIU11_11455 [Bacteroidales bacterium]|jgi:hypothetical protein|nr:hypothetical protein [Bacteroidales bacterium]MBR6278360.1 hypothetical protein [Bacteroidales bacterium]
MKNLFWIILAFLFLSTACFRTKSETEDEKKQAKIRDSLVLDSVNKKRNTPDTTIATFKRTVFCDKKLWVVFDRVKMLSGDEAAEYALRHKRFGNNVNVIVNQEVTLETLAIYPSTPVYVYTKVMDDEDSLKYHFEYVKKDYTAVTQFKEGQIMEIIVLHQSIVYVKQKEL